jgi:hypothetical protein
MVTIKSPMIERDGGIRFESDITASDGKMVVSVKIGEQSAEMSARLVHPQIEILKHEWGFAFFVRDGVLFLRKYKNGKAIEDVIVDEF